MDADESKSPSTSQGLTSHVYWDVQRQRTTFILMWNLIQRIVSKEKERSKLYEILLTIEKEKGTGGLLPVCCVIHLRKRCEQRFQINPNWCFQFTRYTLSKLLQRVDSDVRNVLGRMLVYFNANMEDVARTDITELFHAFDKEVDNDDLIAMARLWTNALIKINQRGTNLQEFVISYLDDYTVSNKDDAETWDALHQRVYQWKYQQL